MSALTPGRSYSFRLVAVNAVGHSAASAATHTAMCKEEPSTLAAPAFVARTTSSITMQWVAPEFDNGAPTTKYRLTIRDDTAVPLSHPTPPPLTTLETSGTATALEIADLTPGVAYAFAVQAYNGVLRSYNQVCAWHARACTPCMHARVHPADVQRSCHQRCTLSNGDGWSPLSAFSSAHSPVTTPPLPPEPVALVERQVCDDCMLHYLIACE